MFPRSFEPLTAGGPGGGVARVGFSGGLSGFDSSSSSSGSSSSGRRGGGGGGARLGHWPISAFSKDTGWEKSESLRGGQEIQFMTGKRDLLKCVPKCSGMYTLTSLYFMSTNFHEN